MLAGVPSTHRPFAWTPRGRTKRYRAHMAPFTQSFVVRIDAGTGSDSPDKLRGTVVHVATGDRRYVTSYGELCSFIEARRGTAAHEAPPATHRLRIEPKAR